ncbi:MoxR family ATPase [Lentisphaerota bacterium WC36G]|nr:MoxR family ATPase [Lentisphaerae bacterium WC36]
MNESVVSQEQLTKVSAIIEKTLAELNDIILGKEELHKMMMVAILSKGHVLLEGLPGVGKTALVKALGDLLKLQFNRVQFTPDLMPSDILGTNILQEKNDGSRIMEFRQGPVFTNILLADEINRASPKTQSAMLEAMQESAVTLLGETRNLPHPFFVLASQNPIEMEGTYPIPEAQLDRFMFKLYVDSVDSNVLNQIITSRRRGEPPQAKSHLTSDELLEVYSVMGNIYLPNAVANYIARLVEASHVGSCSAISEVNEYVAYGASPRAAIAIAESARAVALLDGRPTVGFDDVKFVTKGALNHRLILNYKAKMDNISVFDIIDILLNKISETNVDLPKNVTIEA